MSRLCEEDRIGVRTYTPNGLLRAPEYCSNVHYAQSVTEYAPVLYWRKALCSSWERMQKGHGYK